ncbi:unnamed protein product, partial [Mesorhabditis spiculigera]
MNYQRWNLNNSKIRDKGVARRSDAYQILQSYFLPDFRFLANACSSLMPAVVLISPAAEKRATAGLKLSYSNACEKIIPATQLLLAEVHALLYAR